MAIRIGLTTPACTSESCKWNIPTTTNINPVRVMDMNWKKIKYKKGIVLPLINYYIK